MAMFPLTAKPRNQVSEVFVSWEHNWHLIDTIDRAKANNLKPYNYFELLLT